MKDIATQLTSGELSNIWLILVIGALTLLTNYLGTRVTKTAEFKSLNEQFSTLVEQQRVLASAIGKINHDFNKEAMAFQIRLGAYHAKSIEAIESCHIASISVQTAFRNLFTANKEEQIQFAFGELSNFKTHIIKQKIWLPSDIASLYSRLLEELQTQLNNFSASYYQTKHSRGMADQQIEGLYRVQTDFFNYVIGLDLQLTELADKVSDRISKTLEPSSLPESPPTDSHTPAT